VNRLTAQNPGPVSRERSREAPTPEPRQDGAAWTEKPPLVSVIIPVFNGERYLAAALDSVLAQTYPNLEILVVDDGSSDRSVAIARGYGDRVQVFTRPNGGPAAARNSGLAHAKGAYVSFLDSDDLWLPEKTAKQVACLEAHPEWGVCYGKWDVMEGGDGVDPAKWTPAGFPEGWIFESLLLHQGFMSINTVMVRRTCFEEVGTFNESLQTAEDTNMFLRLARHFQFGFLPESLARYRINEAGITKQSDVKRGTFSSLDHIASLYPELDPARSALMRRAYSIRYVMRATGALNREEGPEARRNALQAIRYEPLRWKPWLIIAFSWVPGSVVRFLRECKRRA
jgi:glycosyltransferase involved in cell wall biosynthesis